MPARLIARRPAPAGFTLIELLICVVIVGLLAAFAVPRFANTKGKANVAAVKSDLQNLSAGAGELRQRAPDYAPSPSVLGVTPSPAWCSRSVLGHGSGWSRAGVQPAAVPVTWRLLYYGPRRGRSRRRRERPSSLPLAARCGAP
jgi:prepilin-type N-terminal cleavage/methylation domain-containing protein